MDNAGSGQESSPGNTLNPSHPPRIELLGPIPEKAGRYYCATCVMIYLGVVSTEPEMVADVQRRTREAIASGEEVVLVTLPEMPYKPLRTAITVAYSQYLPYPAPVCWVHVIPLISTSHNPEASANGQGT